MRDGLKVVPYRRRYRRSGRGRSLDRPPSAAAAPWLHGRFDMFVRIHVVRARLVGTYRIAAVSADAPSVRADASAASKSHGG
jgi:hypothetical protein